MALYAALLYYPAGRYWSEPDEARFAAGYGEFGADAATASVLRGGEALHPPGTATTVTVADGKGGEVVVSEGPYGEAKEVLGGFFLIDVPDRDDAIKWVAQIPAAWRGKVELRPVVPMNEPTPRGA